MATRQMEFNEYIAPDGLLYRFDTNTDKFLMSETGMGMPPVEYLTTRGPFQHGQTVVDYRLGTRVVQLVHRRSACSREDYWQGRSTLLDMIRPNRQFLGQMTPGRLRKRMPDGTYRELKVLIEQGPEFVARRLDAWDEYGFTETLRFIAHNPIFYNPAAVVTAFFLSSSSQLILPFTLPFILDPNGINSTISITYDGNWETNPRIMIYGPLSGPTINNLTTGEKLQLIYDVANGEVLTITTDYGNKAVSSSYGTNLLGALSSDSDLSTFHIAPPPEAPGGINTIQVTGSAALIGTTAVVVSSLTCYIGI